MRFVFTSRTITRHHLRLLGDLGGAVLRKGGGKHNVVVTDTQNLEKNFIEDTDVVLAINVARPEYLPKRIRHIVWVQDLMNWPLEGEIAVNEDFEAKSAADDIIYTHGDGRSVGVDETDRHHRGALNDGARAELLDRPYKEPEFDLSFAGYIPPQVERWAPRDIQWNAILQDKLKEYYHPLRGELDPICMYGRLKEYAASIVARRTDLFKSFNDSVQTVKWMIIEYCRQLDRMERGRLMLSASENCAFLGGNWEKYPEFQKWHIPHTDDPEVVYDLFQRSKLNLHVNITGFGITLRVLECMATGGFLMSHATVRNCVGQLTGCFTPDVHYGVFTPENFQERVCYWLGNPDARKKAATEAREIVRSGHLWEHRGAQILKDLSQ